MNRVMTAATAAPPPPACSLAGPATYRAYAIGKLGLA